MHYLRMPFSPWFGLVSTGIIFAIYLLNRYTDIKEDFANDIGKLLFFTSRKFLFQIGIISLCFVLFVLTIERKLTAFPVLLVVIGILYSFRMIPWYNADQGLHFRRLKEFMLIKNLIVATLWGGFVFILPSILADSPLHLTRQTTALIVGFIISTFSNTLFSDIRDLEGDRIAGNQTIPVTFGTRSSYRLLALANLIWLAFAEQMWQAHWIDTSHLLFIAVLNSFPFICIFLHRRSLLSRKNMDFFAELDLVIFAAGMFALS